MGSEREASSLLGRAEDQEDRSGECKGLWVLREKRKRDMQKLGFRNGEEREEAREYEREYCGQPVSTYGH